MSDISPRSGRKPSRERPIALVDLLDRLLAGGVVITGDITISVADVDLVRISLRALVASIRSEMTLPAEETRVRYEDADHTGPTYTICADEASGEESPPRTGTAYYETTDEDPAYGDTGAAYTDTALGIEEEVTGYVKPKTTWRPRRHGAPEDGER